ncbi:MAG: prepilin-type N-terminal cleavage/methylation domain-containing protein [bacterium]
MIRIRLRRSEHESGFTMVEVLVVLAIVGILAATVIPSYLRTRPQRMLSATTNLLVANFNSARVLAIQNNANVYMEFLPEVDTFRIWDQVGWNRYLTLSVFPAGSTINSFSISPVKTFSPLLRYSITAGVPTLFRNLGSERAIGGEKVVPLEVDIRMDPNPCTDQDLDRTALTARPPYVDVPDRMKLLSRVPALFLQFNPDGSVSSSWSNPCTSVEESLDANDQPPPGRYLGVTEIFLQVRGDMNPMYAGDYLSNYPITDIEGIFPNQSLETMYYEDGTPRQLGAFQGAEREIKHAAMSDANGRRIIINNATGRVIVENWAPYNIDIPPREGDEVFSEDDSSYPNRKHWL